jgi:hypothetical protein
VHGQRAQRDHRHRALGSRTAVLQPRDLDVFRRPAPRPASSNRPARSPRVKAVDSLSRTINRVFDNS